MVNPHKKSRCDLCMFEMETRKNILERLKQYYTETAGDKVNLVEGGFAWDTLSANAKEFEKAYAEMALIIEASFPQTSWGDWLTKKAEEHGIIRQKATNSSVILTVTGQAGTVVQEGSLFSTNDGKNFLTVERGQNRAGRNNQYKSAVAGCRHLVQCRCWNDNKNSCEYLRSICCNK